MARGSRPIRDSPLRCTSGRTFGFASTPSFQGGNDYAQGGARVNSPSVRLIPPGTPNISIAQQVIQFIAKGPLDPNALYQIQGGGNDLLTLGGQYLQGQISLAQLQARARAGRRRSRRAGRQAATPPARSTSWCRTSATSGKTPYANSLGPAGRIQPAGRLLQFDAQCRRRRAGLRVIQFDTFKLQNEIVANPAAFGFVNVTQQVCTTSSSLQCTPATLKTPDGNMTWFWADAVHPTTGAAAAAGAGDRVDDHRPAADGRARRRADGRGTRQLARLDGRMMSGVNRPATTATARKFQFVGVL